MEAVRHQRRLRADHDALQSKLPKILQRSALIVLVCTFGKPTSPT
jgi:hypothetical protein